MNKQSHLDRFETLAEEDRIKVLTDMGEW